MLRLMRTHRRGWTPPLPLSLIATLAFALPLGTTGCQKIKEVTGQDDKDEEDDDDDDDDDKEKTEEEKTEDEAKAELEVAKEAGLADSALAATPELAVELTKLDDLLSLVPKSGSGEYELLMVVRDASVFLDYADEVARFAEGPIQQFAAAAKDHRDLEQFVGLSKAYPMFKAQYESVKSSVESSGVHLDKGMLLTKTDGVSYIIYSGDKPEALGNLIKTFNPDIASDLKCKGLEAPGYIVCADGQADLDLYEASGADAATVVRARLAEGMPGVDFEASNIIADAEGVFMAVETLPGLMVISMAPPQDESDFKEVADALTPATGKLLGSVQPGAGFIWANVSRELMTREFASEFSDDSDGPQSAKDLANKITGEFLFSGHYEPAAVALQIGLDDADDWAAVVDAVSGEMDVVKKGFNDELAIEGGTWDIGLVDVTVAGSTVKALHAGLSGVPEADVLAQMTGLTIDGWVFAGNGALHMALGASPEAIGLVAEASHEGPSAGLQAYLPPSLSAALMAGQVSMIAHVPLDSLHSPQTHNLLESALKNVPEVTPAMAIAGLNMMSPLSNGTMWMTHNGGKIQLHMAVQAIGHHADQEGKDALAAAVEVANGAEPAAVYGPLVAKYPMSARVSSYNARAGAAQASLVASGVGAMVAVAALVIPAVEGVRNEEISEDLEIEEGAADKAKDKAKEDSKKKKKKTKPKPDPKDDEKDDTKSDTGGDDDTKSDTGGDDTKSDTGGDDDAKSDTDGGGDDTKSDTDSGDDGDDGRPPVPKIIPKRPDRMKN